MKCPKCGNEVIHDSIFCEYCGAQIRKQKKSSKTPWVVLTIVFGVLVLCLFGVLAYIYISKTNEIIEAEYERDNAEAQVYTARRSKIELEEQLKVWKDYTSLIPFVITEIQIANVDYNGNIFTEYGNTIYSSNTMYLKPKIKYYGMNSGTKTINVKLYTPSGYLSQGSNSPSGYTYKEEQYYSTGNGEQTLSGWGGTDRGHWTAGTYRFEFWYNNTCLGQKSFTIY